MYFHKGKESSMWSFGAVDIYIYIFCLDILFEIVYINNFNIQKGLLI